MKKDIKNDVLFGTIGQNSIEINILEDMKGSFTFVTTKNSMEASSTYFAEKNGTDWDKRFLDLAEYIGTWSKDRSRGVGAIIVNSDKRVISMGYNGFPSGVDDDVDERHERPAKYEWTVHAESNAIANAARLGISTNNATMYLNLFPCARCAGDVINSGIKRVVVNKKPNYDDEKYGKEFIISRNKFVEAGIVIDFIID